MLEILHRLRRPPSQIKQTNKHYKQTQTHTLFLEKSPLEIRPLAPSVNCCSSRRNQHPSAFPSLQLGGHRCVRLAERSRGSTRFPQNPIHALIAISRCTVKFEFVLKDLGAMYRSTGGHALQLLPSGGGPGNLQWK